MKKLFIMFLVALVAVCTSAQVPQKMSYQAVIRNGDNELVINSNIGMQISILQGSINGDAVYIERHFPATNDNGLVTLEIGGGIVVFGSFDDIDWSSGLYFIKTETDLNGGANYTITGTSQLLSVPYAFYAETTGEEPIWQMNDTNIYYNDGNVGIGTNTPTAKFEVQGLGTFKVNQSDILPGAIYAERFGGSVLALRNTDDSEWTTPIIRFERGDGSGQAAYLNTREDDANGIDLIGLSIADYNGIFLTANGNIGIGTTSPDSKLTVLGGDVNVLDIGSGIIMKSPNGHCWRVTIDNSGTLMRTEITCP